MKLRVLVIVFILLIYTCINAQVNGTLTQSGGKLVLRTWGTHQQRGYAQGYLLHQPIMNIFNNYCYQIVAMGSPTVYNTLLNFYLSHFEIEPKYQQEAQGMVDGLTAAGAHIFLAGLQRNLIADDILTMNCLVDLYYYQSQIGSIGGAAVNCASLSSWGTSTQADTLLQGTLVISRFMDWNQDDDLIANPLLLISHPSEANEQDWVSFTYPGMFGALSAISASGKAAFLNTGNVHTYNNLNDLHPILLSIRNAIEADDYNADGADNINDVFQAITDETSLSGTIVHTVSENPAIMAGIVESNNNEGTVLRTYLHNDNLPPGMHLIATNHFRLLQFPVCCTRYGNIVDSLEANQQVNAKRQFSVLRGAAGLENNMMAIQYEPLSGKILWSTATLTQPAYSNELTQYFLDDLLTFTNPITDESANVIPMLKVYPNPIRAHSKFKLESSNIIIDTPVLYNLKGQKVASIAVENEGFVWNGKGQDGQQIQTGIYLLKARDIKGKIHTAKLLVLR